MWGLAAIVFTASILIPALKLGGLACLLFSADNPTAARSRKLSRVYAALEVIGRWSMLDVFLGAFLVGLVQFGGFATIQARGGLIAFAAVVVLTVGATAAFDPGEVWPPRRATPFALMSSVPSPKISRPGGFPLIWLVPLLAVAVSLYLGIRELADRGPQITIQFSDSSGLEANKTRLEYRGVAAGIVKAVELRKDLGGSDRPRGDQ